MAKNIQLDVYTGVEASVNAYLFSDNQSMILVDCLRNSKEANNLANFIPMIRVTEMYYIAAECATASLDSLKATDLLDSVRVHRGLTKYTLPALKRDSLNIEIRKEYQKEFLSEGQMFYFYKRKDLPFASLPFTKVPVVADASYVFIKPE